MRVEGWSMIGALLYALCVCGCSSSTVTSVTDDAASAASGGESTPGDSPFVFEDVTRFAGIHHDVGPWPDGTYSLPEIMGAGLALFDANRDGRLDIYQLILPPPGRAAQNAPNRLYLQGPDGGFVDASTGSGADHSGFGQGLAVGDVNDDGREDLFLANFGADALLLGDGDGRFTLSHGPASFADDAWSSAATFCDYDRDGDLDLYVARYVQLDFAEPCRTSAGIPDYCGPQSFRGESDRLYRNQGDGQFEDVTDTASLRLTHPEEAKGLGVVCLDLTGDGFPDFYVANDGEANQLWVNRGDGTFADEALMRGVAFNRHGKSEASMGIAIGDVDGDQTMDLFTTHLTQENNTLYLASGHSLFMDRTVEYALPESDLLYTGFGCGLIDFDNDGDLDLAVANGGVRRPPTLTQLPAVFWDAYTEANLVLEREESRFTQRDGGSFTKGRELSRGLAFGDIDDDGDIDIVQSNGDNSLRIHRNDSPTAGNHWLIIEAFNGNRHAIGARLTVVSEHRSWLSVVQPGFSYQSSSDPRLHFGLGPVDRIDHLRVDWADGSQERFESPGVDRKLVLRKGQGSPS